MLHLSHSIYRDCRVDIAPAPSLATRLTALLGQQSAGYHVTGLFLHCLLLMVGIGILVLQCLYVLRVGFFCSRACAAARLSRLGNERSLATSRSQQPSICGPFSSSSRSRGAVPNRCDVCQPPVSPRFRAAPQPAVCPAHSQLRQLPSPSGLFQSPVGGVLSRSGFHSLLLLLALSVLFAPRTAAAQLAPVVVTTIAGNVTLAGGPPNNFGYSDNVGTAASLYLPWGIAVDSVASFAVVVSRVASEVELTFLPAVPFVDRSI